MNNNKSSHEESNDELQPHCFSLAINSFNSYSSCNYMNMKQDTALKNNTKYKQTARECLKTNDDDVKSVA